MDRTYTPRPLDVSAHPLPDDLSALLERLAENTHEVWAERRLADGWTWGPARDDAERKHPCLVPYGQLPESEKEYDRATARAALRAVLALGYRIHLP
jgi:RyR domain